MVKKEKMYDIQEAAEYLDLSVKTLRTAMSHGNDRYRGIPLIFDAYEKRDPHSRGRKRGLFKRSTLLRWRSESGERPHDVKFALFFPDDQEAPVRLLSPMTQTQLTAAYCHLLMKQGDPRVQRISPDGYSFKRPTQPGEVVCFRVDADLMAELTEEDDPQ